MDFQHLIDGLLALVMALFGKLYNDLRTSNDAAHAHIEKTASDLAKYKTEVAAKHPTHDGINLRFDKVDASINRLADKVEDKFEKVIDKIDATIQIRRKED